MTTFPSRVLYAVEQTVRVESPEERDQRECVQLDKGVTGANHELAQWLLEHGAYSSRVVAKWLDCGASRIVYLRKWAKNGFIGSPFDKNNMPDRRVRHDQAHDQGPLKTKEDFQNDPPKHSESGENVDGIAMGGVVDEAQTIAHLLDTLAGQKAVAEAYRKIFKASSFDSEEKAQIYNAINKLVVKWKIVQSTLDTKGQGNG